jgi:hypothetical protein
MRIRWAGHLACMGEKINTYISFEEEVVGRPRHSWEQSIYLFIHSIACLTTGL